MRAVIGVTAAMAGLLVAACGDRIDDRAQADAKAAGFVPPSVISRLDYGTAMDRRFRRLDRDGNDVLTPDELPSPQSRLRELDRNKDGRISSIEFSEGVLARFDRMDLNRDGTVTSEERETSQGR